MNGMFIQGFSPVLPVIVIVLLGVVSLFLSWWSYQHLTSVPKFKRFSLIALRAASLFLLLFLLLNPFLVRQQVSSENPKIAVFIDNSQSLSVERGNYNGLDSYTNIIQQFRRAENDNFDYEYFLFDDEIYSFDEVNADGFRTNLSNLMEYIREHETSYRASVIFSDGVITNGRNPVFEAQNISIPLITVPVGDTSDVKDIAVTDVDFIQSVYTNTQQTITAEIQQQGFKGEELSVQLIKDGELIESKSLAFPAEVSSQTVEFDQEFSDPGFFDYEIHVPVNDDEFTDQNNRSRFTIEVIEDKTNILSIAFEVHPDVGSVRKVIATDQQNELFSSTYLGNNRFIGDNPRELDEDPDLIVLHGLPDISSPIFEWLTNKQVPILYISTPGSFRLLSESEISELTAYTLASSGQEPVNIQLEPPQSPGSHPILEMNFTDLQGFPPLQTYLGEYQLPPPSEMLITGNYRNTETRIPVLIAGDAAANRRSSLNVFGWYRLEQSRYTAQREFFEQLITNLVSWTSTSPDRENLIIRPAKTVFSENEAVEVEATLFNERGEPEPDANIELTIYYNNDVEESSSFRMVHRQNESYSAEIGNYPQGTYRVEATATKNNRTIGNAETRIRVSRSSAEFLDTKRNDRLLYRLAEFTEGLFLEGTDMERLNNFLLENEESTSAGEVTEELIYVHQSAVWFFIILVLLSVEWIIRRSVSLP